MRRTSSDKKRITSENLSDSETDYVKQPIEVRHKWYSDVVKEEKGHKHYDCILIKLPDQEPFKVYVGDTVLFQSEDTVPFIGSVEQLYEVKSTGAKCVKARWFFRQADVKVSFPNGLDEFQNLVKFDVFYSTYTDNNDVQSILRPCTMIYLSVDEQNVPVERNSKDMFICRYKFDGKVGLTPLKQQDIINLSAISQSKRNELLAKASTTRTSRRLRSNDDDSDDSLFEYRDDIDVKKRERKRKRTTSKTETEPSLDERQPADDAVDSINESEIHTSEVEPELPIGNSMIKASTDDQVEEVTTKQRKLRTSKSRRRKRLVTIDETSIDYDPAIKTEESIMTSINSDYGEAGVDAVMKVAMKLMCDAMASTTLASTVSSKSNLQEVWKGLTEADRINYLDRAVKTYADRLLQDSTSPFVHCMPSNSNLKEIKPIDGGIEEVEMQSVGEMKNDLIVETHMIVEDLPVETIDSEKLKTVDEPDTANDIVTPSMIGHDIENGDEMTRDSSAAQDMDANSSAPLAIKKRGRPGKSASQNANASNNETIIPRYTTRGNRWNTFFHALETNDFLTMHDDENKHTRIDPVKYQVNPDSIMNVKTLERGVNGYDESTPIFAVQDSCIWSNQRTVDMDKNIYETYLIHAHETLRKRKYSFFLKKKGLLDGGFSQGENLVESKISSNSTTLLDGSIILTKYDAEDTLLEIFHNMNYDMVKALKCIEQSIDKLLIHWTLDEQERVVAAFIKNGDDMGPLHQVVAPEKSHRDTMDYFFRCIYSAALLQDVDLRAISARKVIFPTKYGDGSQQYRDNSGNNFPDRYYGSNYQDYRSSKRGRPKGGPNRSKSQSSSDYNGGGVDMNDTMSVSSFTKQQERPNPTTSHSTTENILNSVRQYHPYVYVMNGLNDSVGNNEVTETTKKTPYDFKPRHQSGNRLYDDYETESIQGNSVTNEDTKDSVKLRKKNDDEDDDADKDNESRAKAADFLTRLRLGIDEASLTDFFNVLICYKKQIISPSELIVRVKMIDNQIKLMKNTNDGMDSDLFNQFAKRFLPLPLQVFLTS